MGIIESLGSQFIDVIEYVDETDKILVFKYERLGDEIKQGARLIVREGQVAAFLKGGQLGDIFGPGTFKLDTKNLPILSTLAAFPFGFNSPIKADLYFINFRQFLDNRWGTKNPITVRDPEFNMARLRAFGTFAFRVSDPAIFLREVLAARHLLTTYDIITYLNSLISESLAIVLGEAGISILDIATNYRNFANDLTTRSNQLASPLGIIFTNIVIENISLPEEVEKLIDEQSGIGMASRNMDAFIQYQTARAMRDAAQQEGGLAGLGAGFALGNTMSQTITENMSVPSSKNSIELIKEYKELLDQGILTQEEFDAKKRDLLGL